MPHACFRSCEVAGRLALGQSRPTYGMGRKLCEFPSVLTPVASDAGCYRAASSETAMLVDSGIARAHR